jgi:mannan endo-1,4-beta-mannosidase
VVKFLTFFLLVLYHSAIAQPVFVKRMGNHFMLNGKVYRYIGANYWYGGSLANTEQGKQRVKKELDFLKKNGVENLRVLAGAEGAGLVNGVERVGPPLQKTQGEFAADNLKGLDYLLAEMGKRNMKAVLFLSNNWEWSGGFLQYLNWNGKLADSVMKRKLTWDENRDIVSQFYSCDACKKAYSNQVKFILGRTNSITKKRYVDDDAIMAWELANEPRPMRPSAVPAFLKWVDEASALIKLIDKNHLVTTGSEGEMGTENMDVFMAEHRFKNVDYATIHIWPKNWGWFKDTAIAAGFENITTKTKAYIDKHVIAAQKINKPLVVEEFGLPRDGHSFDTLSTTNFRDNYYKMVFNYLLKKNENLKLGGISFWAFNGLGRAANNTYKWQKGNDLLGDPPMEEQGLNGVFNTDKTTWDLIASYTEQLNN